MPVWKRGIRVGWGWIAEATQTTRVNERKESTTFCLLLSAYPSSKHWQQESSQVKSKSNVYLRRRTSQAAAVNQSASRETTTNRRSEREGDKLEATPLSRSAMQSWYEETCPRSVDRRENSWWQCVCVCACVCT